MNEICSLNCPAVVCACVDTCDMSLVEKERERKKQASKLPAYDDSNQNRFVVIFFFHV